MEVVIIFLRFIKQTRPTSILHSSFFILRIPFYSSYSFLFFVFLSLFPVFFFILHSSSFILRIPFL